MVKPFSTSFRMIRANLLVSKNLGILRYCDEAGDTAVPNDTSLRDQVFRPDLSNINFWFGLV